MSGLIKENILQGIREKTLNAYIKFVGISVQWLEMFASHRNTYGDLDAQYASPVSVNMMYVPNQARIAFTEFNAFLEDDLPLEVYFPQDLKIKKDDRIRIDMTSVDSDETEVDFQNEFIVVEVHFQDVTAQYFGAKRVSLAPYRG